MDGEEDYMPNNNETTNRKLYTKKSSSSSKTPRDNSMEDNWESVLNNDNDGDLGDMSFCIANYMKNTMNMMFIMRSHHMLTDVILEVGSELFHAHKVILAAASPYFKVNNK